MKKWAVVFLGLTFWLAAWKNAGDEPLFVVPKGWPKPAYDFEKNPLSKEKIELGRALFYEPLLSKDGTISCASCHLSFTAFTHVDHQLSHGIGGRIGRRNSLALMNLAWNTSFMWDGAVNHLDFQPLAPLSSPDEMDETLPHVLEKLQKTNTYPARFERAFGETTITGEHFLKALSQFMLTLVSADSKYDQVQRREAVFNEWEAAGYEIFKKNCASCHKEPLFTDFSFENNGLEPDTFLRDGGRIRVTHDAADSLKFRVPTLRNVELSGPFMHDGRFNSLQMVLFHYTEDVFQSKTLSKKLRSKMVLSENDKINLIAFLKTLTDEKFLRDERFGFPKTK